MLPLSSLKKVKLHPASIKYLKLGHQWITEDLYTKKFPKSENFLIGTDENMRPIALLIQDFEHKNVKARLWNLDLNSYQDKFSFENDLKMRIDHSLKKRIELKLNQERDNFYLINGESDFLPGLFVLKLKDQILIQYYALYWKKFEDKFLLYFKKKLSFYFNENFSFWIQERNFTREKSFRSLDGKEQHEFVLSEFEINYQIKINQHYDLGIYTDMSGIRKKLAPLLSNSKRVLNLFSYTGAFSLYALKNGAVEVTSVDLSDKYLDWLDKNIALNSNLKKESHFSLNLSSEKALDKLKVENKHFDLIICDPPSASSDGDKVSNAFKAYEILLPKILALLEPNGVAICFLNTHHISWNKFEEKLKHTIEANNLTKTFTVGKRYKLCEDTEPIKGFHEGDYLKGIQIEFKNKEKK